MCIKSSLKKSRSTFLVRTNFNRYKGISRLRLSVLLLFISLSPYSQETPAEFQALYEPDPVKFHFETPGWYILGVVLILVMLLAALKMIIRYKKNKYRREALQQIAGLENHTELIPQLFLILKRTALHAFGREKVGQLYGGEWLAFLESTGRQVSLIEYESEIADALYLDKVPDTETQENIFTNAVNWVKTHAS